MILLLQCRHVIQAAGHRAVTVHGADGGVRGDGHRVIRAVRQQHLGVQGAPEGGADSLQLPVTIGMAGGGAPYTVGGLRALCGPVVVGAVVHLRRVGSQSGTQVDGLRREISQQHVKTALRVKQRRVGRQIILQQIGQGGHHHHAAVLVGVGIEKRVHLRQILLILGGVKGVRRDLGKIAAVAAQPGVVDLQPSRRPLYH